jgi:hypothetical protein
MSGVLRIMVMVMKNFDKYKSDFWDSDCFYEKELARIWRAYHKEEEVK